MKNTKKGFTLIELLIVIALLGALAVGLLAALDPFEQLKKGTDTGIRNTVSEIHGALIRYYAIKNDFPWMVLSGETAVSGVATSYSSFINDAVVNGELKPDFFALAGDQLRRINMTGTSDSLTVCFQPQSRSFRSDLNTKYDSSGVELSSTAGCSTATTCYWCIR